MRARTMFYALVLIAFPVFGLGAEEAKKGDIGTEEKSLKVEAGVTGVYPSIQGNQAKYSEYRDIQDGTFGAHGVIRLDYTDPTGNFLKFDAVDMGYDDQYYRLDAGRRGTATYFAFYNETPHNITFNAITPYAGAGSSTLAYGGAGAATANTSRWSAFDYSTKRKELGAGARVTVIKPFYFDVSASQEKRTGIKPSGAEGAAAAFGRVIELPQPVDYQTSRMKAEAGYAKQPYFLSLHYAYSQFRNNTEFLNFRNPFLTTQPNVDILTLPPDNSFHKMGFSGSMKLPCNSKFNTNLAYSMARSDQSLLSNIWEANALTPVTLSRNSFHGDVRNQVYDFVLTTNPVSLVEGRLFYKYYDRGNKSDIVTGTAGGTPFINTPFQYRKKSYGAELDFRLRKDLHLITGYRHLDLDRRRNDIPRNSDDVYSAEARWSPMKIGVLRLGYEKLTRSAAFEAFGLTGDDQIGFYVRRFDAASRTTDTYKGSVTISPLDELSFTMGYKYRRTSYGSTILGLQNEETTQFNADVDYTLGSVARVFAYFDFDDRKWTQFQRRYAAGGPVNPYGTVQNATNFNWQSDQRDKTYDFGAALDVFAIPGKLTVRLSADYIRSHGTNDFTYFSSAALTGGRNNDNIDIGNWGSYKREFYMVKLLYNLTASTSLSAGYAYEKYTLSDAQNDGYTYTLGTPPNTYLTGAYANPSYKASVVFMGAIYRFQ